MVLCFCKQPEPGMVKSRLAANLGKERAATVYKTMAEHTVQTLSSSEHKYALYCFPDTQHAFFEHCSDRYHAPLYRQEGKNLGERMFHAMDTHLSNGHPVVLIGSDCPELGTGYINKAFHMLSTGKDIVLGPATDGGYALIGANRIDGSLFQDTPWGTCDVLQQTLARIKTLRWDCACLSPVRDIDTFADYRYYLAHENYRQLFAGIGKGFM